MKLRNTMLLLGLAGGGVAAANVLPSGQEELRVQLCDGATSVQLERAPATRAEAQAVADALMAAWQRQHPDQPAWAPGGGSGAPVPAQEPQDPAAREALLMQRYQPKKPFDNRYLLGDGQKEGHPYRDFEERDITLWERETMKLVLEGAEVFHSAQRLGSTIGVSCDMCHPDAANTHPETYPKYQTQIGRAVLLREMINWCLEHPVRGKKLAYDDPRMLAMEAYIYAQRKGETLQFGKH